MKKVFFSATTIFLYSTIYCQAVKTEAVKRPTVEIFEAIASIAWPVLVLILFIALYGQIKNLLNSKQVSIKVAGMELNIGEATSQIADHVLDLEKKVLELKCEIDDANGKEIKITAKTKMKDWRILWVTENHTFHALEIDFLEKDGVDVIKANTTKEAMEILKDENDSIDAIITGLSRKENNKNNPKAGLDLLRKVKNAGYSTEVYVMCSPNNVKQYYGQLKAAGAAEATSSPLALLGFLRGAGLNCPRQQRALAINDVGNIIAPKTV